MERLKSTVKKQLENLEQNKAVEFFDGDYEELKSILACCIALKKTSAGNVLSEFLRKAIRRF